MLWNIWLAIAAVNGLISVAAGAFGAHGLRDKLSARHLEVFETAARYQMYHAVALLAVAWLLSRAATGTSQASGWCFLIGIIIFSGSLYALALTGIDKLGMITPIGGLAMMIGWALLAWAGIKAAG
jgi:uncharacterized membrane protein YgdD (TMEM256/DUF423 family)